MGTSRRRPSSGRMYLWISPVGMTMPRILSHPGKRLQIGLHRYVQQYGETGGKQTMRSAALETGVQANSSLGLLVFSPTWYCGNRFLTPIYRRHDMPVVLSCEVQHGLKWEAAFELRRFIADIQFSFSPYALGGQTC